MNEKIFMATGLLFSGQGAQFVGMGQSLCQNSELVDELYTSANSILGWDLKQICFEGPDEALTETRVCQPALYVQGYALFKLLEAKGYLNDIGVVFGLSLGELTALAVAGVYDFETGLRLVAERGRLMQEACDATEGGMASVIGGEASAVQELCDRFDIQIANLNCPGQIVISGEKAKVMDAVEAAKDKSMGFKLVRPLNVAGAYHSRLMESAKTAFASFIESFEFSSPNYPVYTNVTGGAISEPQAIKEALIQQIVSSVRFEECITNSSQALKINKFIECGPAKVLAGLVRRTDKSIETESVSEYEDIQALLADF
ncbi:MAG: ACP S-malonyltransferase [Verrucomicrobia bacterium]|nr:ACP S-malonyltransferase [Verrucomicrobiota bacterium]